MSQSGIPVLSGTRRRSNSTSNANNPFNRDINRSFSTNSITNLNKDNGHFVSQIPSPFFSNSQPANDSQHAPYAFHNNNNNNVNNNAGTRRRRNSVGSTISDINKSFLLSAQAEPRKKKSKSIVSTTNPQYRRNSTIGSTMSNTVMKYNDHNMRESRRSLQSSYNLSMINSYDKNNISLLRKDLRPLRDKNFQNAIQQEILDYLLKNKFEVQTNHPISLKSLRQPTQKGFIIIFTWLYKRLDPGYTFQKSVESELYQILKNLNYPYIESINKSQISAVGGSSWYKFLGLLHWLVKLNEKMDMISSDLDSTLLNQPTQELIQMNQPVPDSLEQQDKIKLKYESMIESLVIEYTMDAYKCFLNSNDDFSVPMNKFQVGFEKFIKIINLDIKTLDNQNEVILKQYESILQKATKLRIAKERNTALQNDVKAFENYISVMKEKSKLWPKKLQNMKSDKEQRQENIAEVEKEIKQLSDQLNEKNISVEQIETKNKTQEFLLQSLDDISDKSDRMISTLQSKRIENKNVAKNLLNVLDIYNQTLQSILKDRFILTGRNSPKVDDFKINIGDTLQTLNDNIKLNYNELFKNVSTDQSFSLKNYITEKLIKLIEDIENNCNNIQSDITDLNKEIESFQKQVKMNSEETKKLRESALQVQSNIFSLKQEYEKSLSSQRSEIDELSKRNLNTNKIIDKKLDDAKQIIIDKKHQLSEVENTLILQKQDLQNKIFDIVTYIVEFKLKIQDSLEENKKIISGELQKLNIQQ
ncbi:kinetochore-associated Ndc80 complex subunit NDC80 PWA37_001119 [Arxiozyma heterogenica]|uniref:kinetochore-associated Ndc80 complex subunit NDC80 n=1 Tax=Arxiozyma heterogenica TaxID=278026 RepID=UPI002F1850E4